MVGWWDEFAIEVQRGLTQNDEGSENFEGLENPRIKRAVLHTRYDMGLVTAYLSAVNRQLNDLKRIGWVLIGLIAILILTLWLS